jgi:hypothetical protein
VRERERERERELLVSAEPDTIQTERRCVGRIICMYENCTWQLPDMQISFIDFILILYFPNFFWILHVYLMPKRLDGCIRFGSTGVDASKMRT